MARIERAGTEFCAIDAPEPQCLCSKKQHFLNMIHNEINMDSTLIKQLTEKYEIPYWETFYNVIFILCTIMPVVFFIAIARIAGQEWDKKKSGGVFGKFIIEFVIIVIPTVLFVNVLNKYIGYVLIVFGLYVLVTLYHNYKTKTPQNYCYNLGGGRSYILTLVRAIINLLTAICILAVDFTCFPKDFRKTRRYGAGLMDIGIGLFVFAMGAVSRPPKTPADYKRAMFIVLPLLFLGLSRTLIILHINYNQDVHEYGQHLNAFFTLGLTKLLGSSLSGLVKSGSAHVATGAAIAVMHEFCLQWYISQFVMDAHMPRDAFVPANREGIFSLPGFVVIYLISIAIGKALRVSDGRVSYKVLLNKLRTFGLASIGLWLSVISCIFTISIARVTCNLGYILWILAIALTMIFISMLVFHLVLNISWSTRASKTTDETYTSTTPFIGSASTPGTNVLPTLVEAVNKNGLTFFLLANVLTGFVNMFLEPSERYDNESIFILTIYMLISTGFVQLLHHFSIRLA
ncbi:phosphatidylinositol-glycan biosynthesis class W protein [Bactrocera dorsalis]|uniref:Phosphatidylinositol-glycan biosynthesis class W protein n=1 Tax=Bactrocera dorsalis TaxID=27457 RepID=A0A6I9UV62_BACDO|nr:phosphatidylinositol-glycan biosynthesis class W protein [Bactrocera dorsalis]